MSMAGRDGAWVSATRVVRMQCTKCGVILTSRWPMNDRELEDAMVQHLRDTHAGVVR